MKIFRIAVANVTLSTDKKPTKDTVYIRSERLVYQYGTSNKEYIVRVYKYPDGMYSTIGFNGRIGGKLTVQPKALTHSLAQAVSVMSELIWEKEAKGYDKASQVNTNRAPGIHESEVKPEPVVEISKEETKEEPLTEKEQEGFEKSDLAELLGCQKRSWYKKAGCE